MSESNTIPAARLFAHTPDSETLWRWIAFAFVAYWALFVSSASHRSQDSNDLGGVLIIAIIAWAAIERLWVKLDIVVAAAVGAMLIPVLRSLAGDATQTTQAIFKHESICAVMAISRLLRLGPASQSKARWVLGLPVLAILLISIMIGNGDPSDLTRRAGLFVNPNNLALIPFLLLFLIDESRDPLALRLCVHAIVIAVLIFSGTSGAIVAYAIGLAIHFSRRLSPQVLLLAMTGVLAMGSTLVATLLWQGPDLLPETRLVKQVELMTTQFRQVMEGGQISFYEDERLLGAGATSGVWRLTQWRLTIETYAQGTPVQQLLGFGIGSSAELLGKLPHNEYLRVLFEQGVIGLILFLAAWRQIIRTAPAPVRYVALIVAIYSFSENNLDNFPFMALLILFLSARIGPASWIGEARNESPDRQ